MGRSEAAEALSKTSNQTTRYMAVLARETRHGA
jgi:hypothetical protein